MQGLLAADWAAQTQQVLGLVKDMGLSGCLWCFTLQSAMLGVQGASVDAMSQGRLQLNSSEDACGSTISY